MRLRILRPHLVIALALAMLASIAPSGCGGGDFPEGSPLNPIRIFFVTSAEADAVRDSGDAVATHLTEVTGYSFDAVVSTAYQTVIEAMGTADADLAFLPTAAYIEAYDRYEAEVALCTVRYGDKFYRAQFIARADKGFSKLEDFENQVWGFSDYHSTSGHVIPNMMLDAAGIKVKQKITTGGHPNTVQQVYEGTVDFGTTFWSPEGRDARSTQVTAYPDVFERVKIVQLTIPIPNDTVTFRRAFDPALKQVIVDALIAYVQTDVGRQALYDMYNIDGLAEVDHSFYADFAKIVHGQAVVPEEEITDEAPTKGQADDPYIVAASGAAYSNGSTMQKPKPFQHAPSVAVRLSDVENAPVKMLTEGRADAAVLGLGDAVGAAAAKGRVLAVAEIEPGVTTRRVVAYAHIGRLDLGLRSIGPDTTVGAAEPLDLSEKSAIYAFARHLGATRTITSVDRDALFADTEDAPDLILALEPINLGTAPTIPSTHRAIAFSPPYPEAVVVASPRLNPAALNNLLKAVTATREGADAYPGYARFVPADKSVLGDWADWLAPPSE